MKIISLAGKIAIVTGANGLIGKHHCFALSEAGAIVIATDTKLDKIEEYICDLPTKGDSYQLDVTDNNSINCFLHYVISKYNKIDILVNNAAINDMFENPKSVLEESKYENYPLKLWQHSLDVNLTGVFLMCQVFGKQMAQQGHGNIINIASTYGIVAPNQDLYVDENGKQLFYKPPAYSVTKAGIIALTKFLAAYWGKNGVRVNSLSPGGVENNQTEVFVTKYSERTALKRMAFPTDYKGAIIFMASDASNYMTGENLVVDGGFTIW